MIEIKIPAHVIRAAIALAYFEKPSERDKYVYVSPSMVKMVSRSIAAKLPILCFMVKDKDDEGLEWLALDMQNIRIPRSAEHCLLEYNPSDLKTPARLSSLNSMGEILRSQDIFDFKDGGKSHHTVDSVFSLHSTTIADKKAFGVRANVLNAILKALGPNVAIHTNEYVGFAEPVPDVKMTRTGQGYKWHDETKVIFGTCAHNKNIRQLMRDY